MFDILKRLIGSKAPFEAKPRGSLWPKVRAAFLQVNPHCAACGGKEDLEAHHITPYHVAPHLEYEHSNLITLCDYSTRRCHFRIGHLLYWRSWNPHVREDAALYLERVRNRP